MKAILLVVGVLILNGCNKTDVDGGSATTSRVKATDKVAMLKILNPNKVALNCNSHIDYTSTDFEIADDYEVSSDGTQDYIAMTCSRDDATDTREYTLESYQLGYLDDREISKGSTFAQVASYIFEE